MPSRLRNDEQVRALLYHARAASPFCSEDGEPCASIPSGIESRKVLSLRSAAFRDWITANYYSEYESAPCAAAFQSALRTLEARARYGEFRAQRVGMRIGFEGDPLLPSKIIFDLSNAAGELVEMTARGWRVTSNLGHPLRESPAMLPLPRPLESARSREEPLTALAQLLRLGEIDGARVLAWLVTALRPGGPYPILVLRGPAGCGKSLLARALRAIVDPSAAPVRRLPAAGREILPLASENWMLVFDPVHRVPANISNMLSAIASGEAVEVAQPDDRERLVIQVARPIVLVVPTDEAETAWTLPRSFSNRTLVIELDHLRDQRPEAALWAEFEALQPAILATLADAVSTALDRIREIDLGHVTRFPDGAAWVAAAAPALGLSESEAVAALTDPDAIWIGADPLRDAVQTLLLRTPIWTGQPAALLRELRAIGSAAALPATARALSQALSGLAGIEVSASGGSQSVLTLARSSGAPQEAAGI